MEMRAVWDLCLLFPPSQCLTSPSSENTSVCVSMINALAISVPAGPQAPILLCILFPIFTPAGDWDKSQVTGVLQVIGPEAVCPGLSAHSHVGG